MSQTGRILIADDEATFLHATADLLRGEGYQVETASDADGALRLIDAGEYDLVISDLEMPGNEGLRLVREVAQRAGGVPIIILTGFPSAESAIACIELPVAAYLLKPVQFAELLAKTRTAVSRFRSWQVMRRTEDRLGEWQHDLEHLGPINAGRITDTASVDAFLALTLRNVMGSLTDITALSHALNRQSPDSVEQSCHLMNCPRGKQLQEAIRETIDVLEETKSAFKSKTLASLRQRLELLLPAG